MPTAKQLQAWLEGWATYIGQCLDLPMGTPACRPIWTGVMYASFAVGVVIALWVVWRIIDHHRKLRAALRAQEERDRVAPPDVMERYKFKEVGDLIEDVTDPNLAQKIRKEMADKKLADFRNR